MTAVRRGTRIVVDVTENGFIVTKEVSWVTGGFSESQHVENRKDRVLGHVEKFLDIGKECKDGC